MKVLYAAFLVCAGLVAAETPNVPPVVAPNAAEVEVGKLSSDNFATRTAAKEKLAALGEDQIPYLLRVSAETKDPEVKVNVQWCAKKIFEDKVIRTYQSYFLLASNLYVDFSGVVNYPQPDLAVYGLEVNEVPAWSAFNGLLKKGDRVIGVMLDEKRMTCPIRYKPANGAEALSILLTFAPSFQAPEKCQDKEVILCVSRDAEGQRDIVSIKATISLKDPKAVTEAEKEAMQAYKDLMWAVYCKELEVNAKHP